MLLLCEKNKIEHQILVIDLNKKTVHLKTSVYIVNALKGLQRIINGSIGLKICNILRLWLQWLSLSLKPEHSTARYIY